MKSTYLVQRLTKPHSNKGVELFSFGGGLKNGGLSENAMQLLRSIFSFDYMGSAEFEFGAIPEAFKKIADNISKYSSWELNVNNNPLYIIGNRDDKEEINSIIKLMGKGKARLKVSSRLEWALGTDKYAPKRECDYIGWLEIDNGFIFFIEETAFNKTCELFSIKNKQ